MIPVRLLHAPEIGEGLFPVGVPVIQAGAVEAGADQDGEVFQGRHGRLFKERRCRVYGTLKSTRYIFAA